MGAYGEHAEKAQRKCSKQGPNAPLSPPLRPFTIEALNLVFTSCPHSFYFGRTASPCSHINIFLSIGFN